MYNKTEEKLVPPKKKNTTKNWATLALGIALAGGINSISTTDRLFTMATLESFTKGAVIAVAFWLRDSPLVEGTFNARN